MIVLVTQADGSARRFTWITYAIVAGLIAFYVQQRPDQQAALQTAQYSRQEALSYLAENPFVEVDERFGSVIPLRQSAASRREFFDERREQGLALMSDHLMRRGQREFNLLLNQAQSDLEQLPAWKLGIRSGNVPGANWVKHVGVHETRLALGLCIVLLLCLGIALEDAWGSIIFACLAAAGVITTGFASGHVGYFGATGVPWIGASGLVATLMGAYFVRSSPLSSSPRALGMIPMPSWILLLVWLGIEYGMVRGVSSPVEIVNAPVIVHGVGFGLGALVSAVMLLLRVEDKSLEKSQEAKQLVDNRLLERAMLAKDAGRFDQAFELLRKEYRRSPEDCDVALALWDVSTQLGKASRVFDAMISVIESNLREGSAKQAVANWFAMTEEVTNLSARPQFFVRIGEVLLDAGHAEEAMAAMARAVDGTMPLTTALAQRIVRLARDLDPDLTRRAAQVALKDGQLGVVERKELDKLTAKPRQNTAPAQSAAAAKAVLETIPDTAPESETTAVPAVALAVDAVDVRVRDTPAEIADATAGMADPTADTNVELGDSDERRVNPVETDEDISALDPQALSLDLLEEELDAAPADIESQENWNNPGLVEDLSDELEGVFDELDDDDLMAAAMEAGLVDDTVTVVNVDPPSAESETTVTEVSLPLGDGGETTTAVDIIGPVKRSLKIRNAVPIALESEAILIEVDGGSKTRLPYERIEALAAGAVKGLGDKPVVLIDLIVNWPPASVPMKVIRMRSDQFDPAQLTEGAANQLEAFRRVLVELLRLSNATPLPDFNGATGAPFKVFAGLEQYNLEVLEGIDEQDG
jgi:membrane associated rhomboid family serine protease